MIKKRVLYAIIALALVLSIAIPIRGPVMAQLANSVNIELKATSETTHYRGGTIYYEVTVTNQNIAGANSAEVDVYFYPPGPTGEMDADAYGSEIVLDLSRVIAVGETVVYNWDGSGGAEANPGLKVDVESIPLDEGVTIVWAEAKVEGLYEYVFPFPILERDREDVDVIWPNTRVSIDVDTDAYPDRTVVAGEEFNLIITEENTGDVELTDVFVRLRKRVPPTTGSVETVIPRLDHTHASWTCSGNQDDVLDPGEIWTWTYSVTIAENTRFIALGFGTDPLDNEVSFATGYEDERDTVTITATEVEPAQLGGFVWEDLDGDGIQDAGEPGIEGVTVNLLDCATSAVLATNTTDASGHYLFPGLTPGEYKVEFVLPEEDWAFTVQNADGQGIEGEVNSDAHPSTGITECVTLGEGDAKLFVDAGMYKLAQLGGFVWHDENRDGIQGPGEPGIEGVTVRLLDCATSGVLATNTTDADGLYLFTDLTPGDYKVEFVLPTGYVFSPQGEGADPAVDSDADPVTGRTACVSLESGESDIKLDAGMYQPAPATLGGFVWDDENREGIQDAGEPGIEGVTVRLLDCDTSAVLATNTTDADGLYLFPGLTPGDYKVQFILPEGDWVFTIQDVDGQGIEGELNSDAHPTTGITECVTLAEEDVKLFVDAGMYEIDLYRICGFKYEADTDPLEGLGGWTIILQKWDEDTSEWVQVSSQTTGADGSYCFIGHPEGEYRVMETLKFGWERVSPVDPDYHEVTLPNGDPISYDFHNLYTYTPPDITVGWDGQSVNKVAVLAPWIALMMGTIACAVLFVRRRQAQG